MSPADEARRLAIRFALPGELTMSPRHCEALAALIAHVRAALRATPSHPSEPKITPQARILQAAQGQVPCLRPYLLNVALNAWSAEPGQRDTRRQRLARALQTLCERGTLEANGEWVYPSQIRKGK